MKPKNSTTGLLTPAAVRYIRALRAERRRTGRRVRPLRKQLCARWGISSNCFEDAARGRTYRWVK